MSPGESSGESSGVSSGVFRQNSCRVSGVGWSCAGTADSLVLLGGGWCVTAEQRSSSVVDRLLEGFEPCVSFEWKVRENQ